MTTLELSFWAATGALGGRVLRRATPWLAGVQLPAGSFRWPWFELLSAATTAVAAYYSPGLATTLPLTALLLAVVAVDATVKLVPDRLTFPGVAIGLAIAVWRPEVLLRGPLHRGVAAALELPPGVATPLGLSAVGALLGFAIPEVFRRLAGRVVGTEPMGMGDSKLLMMVGAFLGPVPLALAIPPALVLGLSYGLVYHVVVGTPPPFGPALAGGALCAHLAGSRSIHAWWWIDHTLQALPGWALAAIYPVLVALLIWLVRRMRRKAADYERLLDDEYDRLESR